MAGVAHRSRLVWWPVKAESPAPAGEPASARWRVTGVAPRLVEVERHKSKARCLLMFSFNFRRVSSFNMNLFLSVWCLMLGDQLGTYTIAVGLLVFV